MTINPRFAVPPTLPNRLGKPEWSSARFWRHLTPRIAVRLVVEIAKLHLARRKGGQS